MRQNYQGVVRLPLAQLVNLYRYQGFRLTGIVVNAFSRFGFGNVSVCTYGCSTANLGTVLASYRLPVQPAWIDASAGNWLLSLQGNIYLDSIQLEFTR